MSLKTSEINKEAKEVIKRIFHIVLKSDLKEIWIKAMSFIDEKIERIENWERWKEMFVWQSVKFQMNNLYWKKFITKK